MDTIIQEAHIGLTGDGVQGVIQMNFFKKRIATAFLAISILLSQNSTVVFAEELNSEIDSVQNLDDDSSIDSSEIGDSVNSSDEGISVEENDEENQDTSNSSDSSSEADSQEDQSQNENDETETQSENDISAEEYSQSEEVSDAEEVNDVSGDTNEAGEVGDTDSSEGATDDETYDVFSNMEELVPERNDLNSSGAAKEDWYKSFEYTLDKLKRTIKLKHYNGSDDEVEVYVRSSVTINGITYKTTIMGDAFMNSYHDLKYVSFEKGCKTVGTHLCFDGPYNIDELDITGLDTSSITDMSRAFADIRFKTIRLEGINTSNVTNMKGMFCNNPDIVKLDLSDLDTSKVTSIGGIVSGCKKLEYVNFSSFNTENVEDMGYLFCEDYKLETVDISNFDFQKVKDMSYMFYGCKNLRNIKFPNSSTPNLDLMYSMFEKCESLESVDLSNYRTEKVRGMTWMFKGCKNLKTVNISSFRTENVLELSSMFSECVKLKQLDLSNFTIKCTPYSMLAGTASLDVIYSPMKVERSIKLDVNYIIDNNKDGISDDGKDYKEIPIGSSRDRFIRKPTITIEVSYPNNGFNVKRDGHCVINAGWAFDYNTRYDSYYNQNVYEIAPYSRYKEVFGNSITREIYNLMYNNESWYGNCYGMVSSAALLYKNKINKNNYIKKGTNSLTSGGYDELVTGNGAYVKLYKNSKLTSLIERYQIWQDSTEYRALFEKGLNTFRSKSQVQAFSDVIKDIKNKGETYLLTVRWQDQMSGNMNGHAMLVDSSRKPKELNDGWTRVYLYDPNYPYFEGFGNNNPDYSYTKSLERYIDLNIKTGQWRIDIKTNAGQSNSSVGYDDRGELLNNSWLFFRKTNYLPTSFNGTAHFEGYSADTCISYACSGITVYDENDKILFFQLGNMVREIDENVVEQLPKNLSTIDVNAYGRSQGKILLPRGKYRVSVCNGYAAFLEAGDYIGVDTDNVADFVNIDSTTASVSTPYGEDIKVVLVDRQGETKFTSLGTDAKVTGNDNIVSLKGSKLTANFADAQNVDIQVSTEKGEGTIKGVSSENLKNFDVELACSKNSYNGTASDGSISNDGHSTSNADIVISQDKNKVSASKLKKKAQKVTISVENTDGKITAKNASSKKLKKYLKVSVSNGKVICKLKKGARKGTYKVKVMVSGDSSHGDITKTIKIKVK